MNFLLVNAFPNYWKVQTMGIISYNLKYHFGLHVQLFPSSVSTWTTALLRSKIIFSNHPSVTNLLSIYFTDDIVDEHLDEHLNKLDEHWTFISVRANSHRRDAITQTWYYHTDVILLHRRDTMYHTDVILLFRPFFSHILGQAKGLHSSNYENLTFFEQE